MSENIIVAPELKYPAQLPAGLGSFYFNRMQEHSKNKKIAQIIHKTGEVDTYESLLQRCVRTSLFLQNLGVKKDDVVCLIGPVHKNSCVSFIASHFIGAIPTCVSSDHTTDDKKNLVALVEPKIVFTVGEYVDILKNFRLELNASFEIVCFDEDFEGTINFEDAIQSHAEKERDFRPIEIEELKDTALMYFSSGTTGVPKAICINHFSMLVTLMKDNTPDNPDYEVMAHNARCVHNNLISIECLQLFWVSAGNCLANSIAIGSTRVLCEKFLVDEFWPMVDKYKVNFVYLAAVFSQNLARTPIPDGLDVSSLFLLLIAGSRVSPEVILKLRSWLHPLATVIQGYAQTEFCGSNTFYNTNDKDHRRLFTQKPHSVGLPGNGYIYKVVDLETNEILGANKQGELMCKAPTLMNGYYKKDSSDAFDADGFYKTGDIAYYDDDKCFYIVDRIKGAIRYSFYMVCSAEIEEILLRHPAVKNAAVFGQPHPDDLNHVTALVEVDQSMQVTPEEVRKFVDDQVPDHKRIRGGIKFVDHIPMTTTGKVKCGELLSSFMNNK